MALDSRPDNKPILSMAFLLAAWVIFFSGHAANVALHCLGEFETVCLNLDYYLFASPALLLTETTGRGSADEKIRVFWRDALRQSIIQ
jgi:hypothetical protein